LWRIAVANEIIAMERRMNSIGRAEDPQREHSQISVAAAQSSFLPLKRVFDVVAALAGLVALSPIMVMVAIYLSYSDRGPIFYAHERVGRGGRKFKCVKFRTMCVDADKMLEKHLAENPDALREWEATQKLKDDPRVFPFGRTLRRTSIDELPQLINILKGEMSVVGPRPVTEPELQRYGNGRFGYLSVRPGLTGLWQVSGRNDVSFDSRVALDLKYIRNWSMSLDAWIVILTFKVVFFQKGSY
jgi:exopolysaccharide production protein ExoY